MKNSEIFKTDETGIRYFISFLNSPSDNANDGKKSSLGSNDRKCAMALVANITWNVATKYSLIYKKNLDTNCKFIYICFLRKKMQRLAA